MGHSGKQLALPFARKSAEAPSLQPSIFYEERTRCSAANLYRGAEEGGADGALH